MSAAEPGAANHSAAALHAAAPLSIVIPALNEAGRIGDAIREAASVLRAGGGGEVIVVDDGSTDATAELARAALAEVDVGGEPHVVGLLIVNTKNMGKGHAVRRGVLASSGGLVLMTDADLSAPLGELSKLLRAVEAGADVAIGSRDAPGALLDPPQPWGRRILARLLRFARRRVLLPRIGDTQCGFKLFRGDVARRVFAVCEDDGWLFDCEVLGVADGLGYRIAEVGVRWRAATTSRVRPLRAAWPVVARLLTLRGRVQRAVARARS